MQSYNTHNLLPYIVVLNGFCMVLVWLLLSGCSRISGPAPGSTSFTANSQRIEELSSFKEPRRAATPVEPRVADDLEIRIFSTVGLPLGLPKGQLTP